MPTMTLRGDLDVPETGTSFDNLIFNYQSPDRTRAWKVTRARFWISDWDSPVIGNDKTGMASAVLATDAVGPNFGNSSRASDNRVFGWCQQQILCRAANIFLPQNGLYGQADFILDSDRIITNQLYINVMNKLEGATSTTTISYLIEMDELKITPERGIILQLKGIGQDIDD